MNRREFLVRGGLAGAGLLAGGAAAKEAAGAVKDAAAKDVAGGGGLTFCAFADIHYYPGVFPNDTAEWMQRILDRALREKAEFVIQLGDMTHRPQGCGEYIERYNSFSLPTYHVIGNHENDGWGLDALLKAYKMPNAYYFFDRKGFRFIILDPNYFTEGGKFVHYLGGNYYWKNSAIPPEQVKWLRETLLRSPHPCVILSHQSFERGRDGVDNYLEVRKVINEANRRFPGRVRLVMNGHYHVDHMRILDGVLYWDVNSANYFWVQKAHDKYPAEITRKHSCMRNTIVYNDPVSAIVTLTADGGIRVKGQKSSLYLGVTSEMSGNPRLDDMGREITADIQSVNLKLSV